MKYYVMSKGKYADGGRGWVSTIQGAWCFGTDHESAQRHAESFSDPVSQRELRTRYGVIDSPEHRKPRVIGILEE